MSEVCPVCFKRVPAASLMDHVNTCLDSPAVEPPVPEPVIAFPPPQNPVVELTHPNGVNEDIMALYRATEARKKQEEAENERLLFEMLRKEEEEEAARKRSNSAMDSSAVICPRCNSGKSLEEVVFLDTCGHHFCKPCLQQFVVNKIETMKCSEILCPEAGCGKPPTPNELKELLTPELYEKWNQNTLSEALANNPNFVKCPKCPSVIERVTTKDVKSPGPVLGPDGKPLSHEALQHRENFRFRCRECQCEFCGNCSEEPYHLGFTCETFKQYQQAKHCRFCATQLTATNTVARQGFPATLHDVCKTDDCVHRRSIACPDRLACGHACGGIKEDAKLKVHSPCLHYDCVADRKAKSQSQESQQEGGDYCNICWTESLSSAPVVRLDCGHYFHFECVQKKVATKWAGAMITFGFLDCPLCKKLISHPSLTPTLKPILEMYNDIKQKAIQRLKHMQLEGAAELKDKATPYFNSPEKYALARFCYYPCFKCKKPYFGGLKECNAEQRVADFNPNDLVCGPCSSQGSETGNCQKHGSDFIEYKCRFCCNVAAWFCWGNTRFCDPCHQKAGEMAKKPKNQLPACTCSIKHPPNGEEFCLGCSVCRFEAGF